TVLVNGDTTFEPDETFFVNLLSAQNAGIVDNQGQGTVLNDDPLPSLSINDVAVPEGNTGTTNAVFTLRLTNPSFQPVTVHFMTADGTPTTPSDYQALSGTVPFAPAHTTH